MTPTIDGATPGTTTYAFQVGQYHRIGNLVWVQAEIVVTASTGTGNAILGGLPFTIKNVTRGGAPGEIQFSSGAWAWPAGTTMLSVLPQINTTTCSILGTGTLVNLNMQMTNGSLTVRYSLVYEAE